MDRGNEAVGVAVHATNSAGLDKMDVGEMQFDILPTPKL